MITLNKKNFMKVLVVLILGIGSIPLYLPRAEPPFKSSIVEDTTTPLDTAKILIQNTDVTPTELDTQNTHVNTTPSMPEEIPEQPVKISEQKISVSGIPPTGTVKTVIQPSVPDIPKSVSTVVIHSFDSVLMLSAHNLVRKKVGVGPLVWSEKLSESAQEWADTLKDEGCLGRHDPNHVYGENIYWGWSSAGDGKLLLKNSDYVVSLWSDEQKYFNYTKNICAKGKICGHYTQLVWRSTTSVGCATNTCFDGDTQTDIWVCRYDPAGNDGSVPY